VEPITSVIVAKAMGKSDPEMRKAKSNLLVRAHHRHSPACVCVAIGSTARATTWSRQASKVWANG
jgi:hypothetical protein